MCASWEGHADVKELALRVVGNLHDWDLFKGCKTKIFNVGDNVAALRLDREKRFTVDSYHFRLVPSWSKTKDIKFATYNARLIGEDKSGLARPVYEAPSFREAYRSHKLLVPMASFVEASYWGELEGHMLRFKPRTDKQLYCAAIADEWVDRSTGEIYKGLSLLVHTPYQLVLKNGHHRSPLFLSPQAFFEWAQISDNKKSFAFLIDNRSLPELECEIQRPMADGWKKRQKEHLDKARQEGLKI